MPNVLVRTFSGLVYVALVVAPLYGGISAFVPIFAAFSALCVWEFGTLLNRHAGSQINRFISAVAAVYLFLAFFVYTLSFTTAVIFVPYLATLLYLLISELYLAHANPLKNWAYAFAAQLYIALPFALLTILAIQTNEDGHPYFNHTLPLAIFIFLWLSDTGAYLFGSSLSRFIPAKLFPRISPNKSWIGTVGGIATAVGAGALISVCPAHGTFGLWQWMGLAAVVATFGTWGDLVESLLKRQLGVKDSGRIMPGHGGALDRFDSFLLAAPAALIYIYTLSQL